MGLLDWFAIHSPLVSFWLVQDMTFFLEWPVEVKFFFIFGCLIGLVLPTAAIIRTRNNMTRTRTALIADIERAEVAEVAQTIVLGEELPFGIQAMEAEDSDVSGLWNSKTSTPLHTPLPSPIISSRDSSSIRSTLAKLSHSRRTSSVSSVSKLELPQPHNRNPQKSDTTPTGVNRITSQRDDAAIPDVEPSSRITIVNHTAYKEWPLTPQDMTERNDCSNSNSESMLFPLLSDRTNLYRNPSRKSRTYIISARSNAGVNATKLIGATSALQDLEVLDRMEAHRRFHAAESGQLYPRTRRAVRSAISPSSSQATTDVDSEESHGLRSISWPIANNEIVVNMTVPRNRPQRRVSPTVTPFQVFVESHPPPKACPSAWSDRTQGLMEEKLDKDKRITSFAIRSPSRERSASTPSVLMISDSSTDCSTISSDEATKLDDRHDRRAISLGTMGRLDARENRARARKPSETEYKRSKKLQKRNRSRSGSDASSTSSIGYYREPLHSTISTIY